MRHRSALALAALAAIGTLALTTGLASAGRYSFTAKPIRAVWRSLRFQGLSGETVRFNVNCQVTLEGSFHSSTISKVSGALIGLITRATSRACTNGSGVVLQETLPWHVRYRSFLGNLPNILAVRLETAGMGWRMDVGESQRCRYQATAERPGATLFYAHGVEGIIAASSMYWLSEVAIPKVPTFECLAVSAELHLEDFSTPVTQLGTTTVVSLTLI